MASARPVVIVADDRTGALETAGRIAQRTGRVVDVVCWSSLDALADRSPILVIDAGTRHLAAAEVRDRMAGVVNAAGPVRFLHKIDSLLRGNWHIELRALAGLTAQPAVLIPALPEADRVCVGGVVRAGGIPVDELLDARAAAPTSRPASLLGATELNIATLRPWLDEASGFAVCDATTAADLDRIAELLAATDEVIVSGSAEVIATAVAPPRSLATGREAVGPAIDRPCVVIVGSVHPLALVQADAVRTLDRCTVIRSDLGVSSSPDAVIADLAGRARAHLAGARTVVVVGGDTAAAVLGDDPMRVGGMVGPGMPWLTTPAVPGAVVITKPGSHGQPATLVEVLSGSSATMNG